MSTLAPTAPLDLALMTAHAHGINTIFHLRCLLTIRDQVTPTPTSIGQAVNSNNAANITVALDSLESRELLTRCHSSTDRRKVFVQLTPQGRSLADDLARLTAR